MRRRLDADARAHLATLPRFDPEYFRRLEGLCFTGEVRAVAEGTPVFAGEPVLEVVAPIVEGQLKLTEFRGEGRLKLSTGKGTLPGRKQVFRRFGDGVAVGDLIACHDEPAIGVPLLGRVMERGRRSDQSLPLDAIRRHTAAQVAALPAALRELSTPPTPYPLVISDRLASHDRDVRGRITAANRRSGGAGH